MPAVFVRSVAQHQRSRLSIVCQHGTGTRGCRTSCTEQARKCDCSIVAPVKWTVPSRMQVLMKKELTFLAEGVKLFVVIKTLEMTTPSDYGFPSQTLVRNSSI